MLTAFILAPISAHKIQAYLLYSCFQVLHPAVLRGIYVVLKFPFRSSLPDTNIKSLLCQKLIFHIVFNEVLPIIYIFPLFPTPYLPALYVARTVRK